MEGDSDEVLQEIEGVSYIRVYPSYALPEVTAVLGSVVRIGSNLPEYVTEFLTFDNSDKAELRLPPVGAVSVELYSFFKTTTTAVYDPTDDSIVLGKLATGIVKVTYTAFFDRFKVTHGGNPCSSTLTANFSNEAYTLLSKAVPGEDKEDPRLPSYDPAFLVGEGTGFQLTTMLVSGPTCEDDSADDLTSSVTMGDYRAVGIKIETDAEVPPGLYPDYFSSNKFPRGFVLQAQPSTINGFTVTNYVGCRIRVYPKSAVTLESTSASVSASSTGSGTRACLQSLTFSGSQSTNLEYPPSSTLALSGGGSALTNYGNFADVTLRGPGEWVNEVEWIDSGRFRHKGNRKVRPDEVVVTSSGRNTLPAYTFGQARYTSDYLLYDVLFDWDPETEWYLPCMVLATDSKGNIGHIQIEPPSRGGIL
jgi:hypothetical protein